MKRVEKAVTLVATSAEGLSEQYNDWYAGQITLREDVPQLQGQAITILDRLFSQAPKGKGTQFGLVIFFEDFLFQPHEVGPDRGQGIDKAGGVSVVKRRTQRTSRG